jgi:hypothetical protein
MDSWPRWYLLGGLRGVADLCRQGVGDDVLLRYWRALHAGADVGGLVGDRGEQSEQGSEHSGNHGSILPT